MGYLEQARLPYQEHIVMDEAQASRAHGRTPVLDVLLSFRSPLLGNARG